MAAGDSVEFEFDPTFDWRLEQLEKEFERFTAFRLASYGADWHKAVRMKRLGFTDEHILDEFRDYEI